MLKAYNVASVEDRDADSGAYGRQRPKRTFDWNVLIHLTSTLGSTHNSSMHI